MLSGQFLVFGLVFVSRDFEVGTNAVAKSRPSVFIRG